MAKTVLEEIAILEEATFQNQASASKKYFAEFLGTMVLVFLGCGSAVLAGSAVGYLGISLAFGLAVTGMAYTIGGISGCHVNPAISMAMFVSRKLGVRDLFGYVASQCFGAIAGAGILLTIALGQPGYSLATGLGQNGYDLASPGNFSVTSAFIAEVVLTLIFVLVVFGSTRDKAPKGFAGLSIGLSLVLIHLVGIPITGTSVNPARSLGPALLLGGTALSQVWLFLVAPILGGLLAAGVWRLIR
jgi:aquaporin Z